MLSQGAQSRITLGCVGATSSQECWGWQPGAGGVCPVPVQRWALTGSCISPPDVLAGRQLLKRQKCPAQPGAPGCGRGVGWSARSGWAAGAGGAPGEHRGSGGQRPRDPERPLRGSPRAPGRPRANPRPRPLHRDRAHRWPYMENMGVAKAVPRWHWRGGARRGRGGARRGRGQGAGSRLKAAAGGGLGVAAGSGFRYRLGDTGRTLGTPGLPKLSPTRLSPRRDSGAPRDTGGARCGRTGGGCSRGIRGAGTVGGTLGVT